MLNSSTITSTVAIYKNVPAEILVNVATTSYPDELTIHPIAIPIGFITAYIKIIIVAVFLSTPAAAKATPKVRPSAHL